MSCLKIYIYLCSINSVSSKYQNDAIVIPQLNRESEKNELEQMILITHKDLEVDLFIVIPCTGEKIKH